MDQNIRFCLTPDGVNIAWATVGAGPPLVKVANWLTHLEFDWQSPVWRHWWEHLASRHWLVRYDARGCGLSDWEVDDLSFEAWVRDLETVVDAVGVERFPLLGISQGGAVAIAYTVKHPERVSHLMLYGAYARGKRIRSPSSENVADTDLERRLVELGWGKDDAAFRSVFTHWFIPGGSTEQLRWFDELQRHSTSPANAVRFLDVINTIDVRELARLVDTPTLVLHSRDEARVPFEEGRLLASLIPGARLVPLDSSNHILLQDEPAWRQFVDEVEAFLVGEDNRLAVGAEAQRVSVAPLAREPDRPTKRKARELEAAELLRDLDSLALARFRVAGGYMRYDPAVRNALADAKQRILAGVDRQTRKRENHLVWAAPGSGKTYFIEQLAESRAGQIPYVELNLARLSEDEMRSGLESLVGDPQDARLCLIDEVDAKADAAWPYELLLPFLDANVQREAHIVFVMAGSSGATIEEMKSSIAGRAKGRDLLSRIPAGNELVIPPMGLGDQVIVAITQLCRAGAELGREVQGIEKIALYYVGLAEHLANPRQLTEFAVRTVERMPPAEQRIKYDHLFEPGDTENKLFWVAASEVEPELVDHYVNVEA